MTEENVNLDISEEMKEDVNETNTQSSETPQPILPDEEYAAEVAKDDPEELDQARRKLMILLQAKCRSVGNDVIKYQIKPMVYSMSLSDCTEMYRVISQKGIVGLMSMVTRHNKVVRRQADK